MNEPFFDYQFRLILIGDSTVGKSSLLKYFTDGKFAEVTYVGFNYCFHSKSNVDSQLIIFRINWRFQIQLLALISSPGSLKLEEISVLNYNCGIQLVKNDFGTSNLINFALLCFVRVALMKFCNFRSITRSYYRNSVGALLVYDICNRASFEHIPRWMLEARRHIEPHQPVFVLVGCKLDLAQNGHREISSEEAKAFAETHGMFAIETSAKNGLHVEEAFVSITQEVNTATQNWRLKKLNE